MVFGVVSNVLLFFTLLVNAGAVVNVRLRSADAHGFGAEQLSVRDRVANVLSRLRFLRIFIAFWNFFVIFLMFVLFPSSS